MGPSGSPPARVVARGGPEGGGRAPEGVRLQRVMVAAGVAARRVCEQMIEEGRVTVNGEVVRTLPVFVNPVEDRIVVNGRTLPKAESRRLDGGGRNVLAQRLIYVMVFKPERVMGTTSDPGGRRTVMEYVDHPAMRGEDLGGGGSGATARLVPAGRLDFHTAGLVLLTNDGVLIHRLTHARFGVPKTYQAVIKGHLDDAFLNGLERGLNLKNARAGMEAANAAVEARGLPAPRRPGPRSGRGGAGRRSSISITHVSREPGKTLVDLTLSETGERPLREMLIEAGCKVTRLTRTAIGPLTLRGVPLGGWRELERDEVRELRVAAGLEGRGRGGRGGSGGVGGMANRSKRGGPNTDERPRRPRGGAPGAGRDHA